MRAIIRRLTPRKPEHRLALVVALGYVGLFFATTKVRPQGTGGLSGPYQVRVFKSESHLAIFYPVHTVERWIRNQSFTYSATHFGVDFEDELYAHDWLYGDGKYGMVWYEDIRELKAFLFGATLAAWFFWRMLRAPGGISIFLGSLAMLLIVCARFSWMANGMWESECLSVRDRHGGGQVLRLRVTHPDGGVSWGARSAASPSGGGGSAGETFFLEDLIYESSNHFLVRFTLQRAGQPKEKLLVVFPFGQTNETKWQGHRITGRFAE